MSHSVYAYIHGRREGAVGEERWCNDPPALPAPAPEDASQRKISVADLLPQPRGVLGPESPKTLRGPWVPEWTIAMFKTQLHPPCHNTAYRRRSPWWI